MKRLLEQLAFSVDARTNDGVVPTLSQLWGRIGGGVLGDHLDVVGQFHHVWEEEIYTTWLHSGSGFDLQRFRSVWENIAAVIAESQT
jgi:hypothetical protein